MPSQALRCTDLTSTRTSGEAPSLIQSCRRPRRMRTGWDNRPAHQTALGGRDHEGLNYRPGKPTRRSRRYGRGPGPRRGERQRGGAWVVGGKGVAHFLFADGTAARRALEAAGIRVLAEREVLVQ